ncbi:SRPBCC family protein [Halobacillus sp. Cin3]|uniref:SRPBCC family protein n=1 Tax=Halobacillus sp. Cin3 TaxID=2928441 RepID=UPI00248E5BD7|nr:SRPBCC family protein [Halobacillus sp. Cin3]
MPEIIHHQFIKTPVQQVFDAARSVELHTKSMTQTKEKAVGGVTEGLLEEGDTVTWEAVHFGVRQRLTARIVSMQAPHRFVDVMDKGVFHSFTHTHDFIEKGEGTLMVDTFVYQSPLGILGRLADRLFLEKYMTRMLKNRAVVLKNELEKDG